MRISEAFRAGFQAVRRSRRLLALVALTDALIALPPAIYVFVVIDRTAAHRLDATHLARHLDRDFFADLVRNAAPDFRLIVTALVAGSLLVFFLVRPFVLGGYVGIAASQHRPRFDDFVREGGQLYWKFLRLSLASLCVMAALSLAARPLLESIDEQARRYQTESILVDWRRITEAVVFAVFLACAAVFDYARVAIHRHRRPGVLGEVARAALFVVQHPGRTLGLVLVVFALEVGTLALAVPVFRWADGGYLVTSVAVFLLAQLLVLAREALRLFHIAGAHHLHAVEDSEASARAARSSVPVDGDLLTNLPWNLD
jgi:hypothetical protein